MHFTAYEFNLLFFKKDKMLKNLTLKCSEKWAVYKPTLSREPHNFDCNISSDFKGHVHPKKMLIESRLKSIWVLKRKNTTKKIKKKRNMKWLSLRRESLEAPGSQNW